ncbi:hypothetical protein CRUP_014105 [Coryphaenoides rupestris]|nr:hypothetical protein CRUP_014105 [Coryphaenoides rupestris]
MEGAEDEVMEVTREELHAWIRREVEVEVERYVLDLRAEKDRCGLLLEKRQRQRNGLLKLSQSVADCELVIRQLYSLLGWDYKDEDSEAEDEPPPLGSNAVEEPSVSMPGADAEGDPIECDEKSKLEHMLVPSEASSAPQEMDSFLQSSCSRTRPVCGKRRHALRGAEVSSTLSLPPAKPLSSGIMVSSVSQTLALGTSTEPPDLLEQKIKLKMKVLARRKTGVWLPGEIVEILSREGKKGVKYKVSLEEKPRVLVSGHHLAFDVSPLPKRLYVGARVVTKYWKDDTYFFYSGILGELPSRKNRLRFLVFLDDHTPTYVGLPVLRLVCRPLGDPGADIPGDAHRRFIGEYLKLWPHPPMAQYNEGHTLNVECEGVQRTCKVLQTDCSLMQVFFRHSGHNEWLYRGSMRLQHLVTMKKVLQRKDEAEKKKKKKTGKTTENAPNSATSTPAAMINYTPHLCSPACLEQVRAAVPTEELRKSNPLFVPMLYKFRRQLFSDPTCAPKETKRSYTIFYYTPCGLTLSTMAQVEEYLHETHCDFLSIDAFSMDPCVSVAGAHPRPGKMCIPDLAASLENKAVPCINEYNYLRPSKLSYTSVRDTSHIGVDASLDFMAGCDCVDGCRDSESCSCRQLTVQGTRWRPVDEACGYTQKRLNRTVVTGVYECNGQCRCDPRTCSNRVAQHGIQVRLQVFMTRGQGWGVRCYDDLPRGTFVCAYSASKQTAAQDLSVKRKERAPAVVPMTTRCFFDGEDHCYIVDANVEGNVARFLNHSCSPNLFQQSVFVDTHDLRFPWLTFFTKTRVKAGTELTWDPRCVEDDAETILG